MDGGHCTDVPWGTAPLERGAGLSHCREMKTLGAGEGSQAGNRDVYRAMGGHVELAQLKRRLVTKSTEHKGCYISLLICSQGSPDRDGLIQRY